jgi:hypothetical protein
MSLFSLSLKTWSFLPPIFLGTWLATQVLGTVYWKLCLTLHWSSWTHKWMHRLQLLLVAKHSVLHPTGPMHNSSEILPGNIHLNNLKLTADFIKALQDASLDDPTMELSSNGLECLHNPLHEQPILLVDLHTRLAIDLFLTSPSSVELLTLWTVSC